jgi:hypothetical protein
MAITIFQNIIFKEFILPFLLVFTIVFALLDKTSILGEDKKQLNAIVAFVVGLIFIGVAYPKDIVNNMVLFLVVAVVLAFITLMLWGFISGNNLEKNILTNRAVMWVIGIAIVLAVVAALVWASGFEGDIIDFLFRQSWSKTFWTNVVFIAVVGVAIAVAVRKSK